MSLLAQCGSTTQSRKAWTKTNGEGVPKNDAEAVTWYRKAAEQGYANAQFNLGYMYASVD